MKKILFATTALVATAGFAAAEVTLSGAAEMGVADNGTIRSFLSNVDVDFTLRGESDSGISFGADIDLDEAASTSNSKESVFISAGGLTATLGDTDGALDKAMQEVNLVGGSLADDETTHAGFNGNGGLDGVNDGQVLRLDYAISGVTLSASYEQAYNGANGAADDIIGLGVRYTANLGGVDIGVGLGYQEGAIVNTPAVTGTHVGGDLTLGSADDTTVIITPAVVENGEIWGISLDAGFGGGFSAAVNYSEVSGTVSSYDHFAIGLGYESGPVAIGVNYGEYSGTKAQDGWGMVANYDFGGGLVGQFGYGSSSTGTDTWSLGMSMSF